MKIIGEKILSLALSIMLVLPAAPLVFAQEGEGGSPSISLEGDLPAGEAGAGRGSEPESIASTSESLATSTTQTEESAASSTESLATSTGETEQNAASTTENLATSTDEQFDESIATSTEAVGTSEIETGDATAAANVVNVVNSNFFNSSAWILFLNNFFQLLVGDIDVRKILESEPTHGGGSTSISSGPSTCDPTTMTCTPGGALSLTNDNTTEIQNDIIVRSETGTNEAIGCEANINTGNAAAAANVVNLANTNVVNSNYVLLTVNNFSDWVGDLILPSGEALQNTLSGDSSGGTAGSTTASTTESTTASTTGEVGETASTTLTLTNENEGTVGNDVSAQSDTGNNTAEAPKALIDTGASAAWSNIINNLNQNLVGGTTLHLVFRVYGDWVGEVWNAPEGVTWTENDGVIEISGDLPGAVGSESGVANTTGDANFANTRVTNTNQAAIQNNISVTALTGANRAKGACDANINTGNALSAANVVNTANTNIFGKNWIVAIINIFGNWRGNVSFGRPNLWVGSRAEIEPVPERSDKARPGSPVKYYYTITNNGDAPASGVILRQKLSKFLSFASADHGGVYDPSTGEISWNLDTLPRGATLEVGSVALIDPEVPGGDTLLESTGVISSREGDADAADNTDIIKVVAYRVQSGGGPFKTSNPLPMPNFLIRKSAQFATTTASSTLGYRIAIKNTGGPAKNAVLLDVITDEKGKVVREKKWNIGDIKTDEEIRVEYSVLWTSATPPGKYTNTAQLMAIGGHPHTGPGEGSQVFSPIVKEVVEVIALPSAPELLMTPAPASTTEPLILATTLQPTPTPPAPEGMEETLAASSSTSLEGEAGRGLDSTVLSAGISETRGGLSSLFASLGALPGNYWNRTNATISLTLLTVLLLTSLYFRRKEELDV